MKAIWGKSGDIASIDIFDGDVENRGEITTVCLTYHDSRLIKGMLNLGFSASGILLSIEVQPASEMLPKELLECATIVDDYD